MPCYSIDEFRSHFRMTKTTFEFLAQELAATGAIPHRESFSLAENQFNYRSRFWHLFGTCLTGGK